MKRGGRGIGEDEKRKRIGQPRMLGMGVKFAVMADQYMCVVEMGRC